MSATLEELTHRVESLERQVAALTMGTNGLPAQPGQEMPNLIELSKLSQPGLSAAMAKFCEERGFTGTPIPLQELRQRMAESMLKKGIRPEDNSFSREIIAMREE